MVTSLFAASQSAVTQLGSAFEMTVHVYSVFIGHLGGSTETVMYIQKLCGKDGSNVI